jgi:hypothetical protein
MGCKPLLPPKACAIEPNLWHPTSPLWNSPSNYCTPTSSSTQFNIDDWKLNKKERVEQKGAMTEGLIAKARGEEQGCKI